MASLYNIEDKYLQLLNQIEENDGVLEDEDAKELKITEDDLEDKLKSYYYVIKKLDGEIKMIDDEIDRLRKLKEVKQNTKTRLKTAIRDAVVLFGEVGKSGNRVIDYGTIKFYTRKNEVVKVDENFYNADYMKYKLNDLLSMDSFNLIVNTLKLKDVKYNVTVDKRALKADLKKWCRDRKCFVN